MSRKSTQILKEISRLISLIEDSNIEKINKLKIIKVLLSVKLKLIELLGKEITAEAKIMYVAGPERNREGPSRTEQDAEHVRGFVRGPQRTSVSYGAGLARNGGESTRTAEKYELILQFIKQNSGRVSAAQLLGLGIAGRSLRRYVKNLCVSGKISVEKKGREHFYTLT